MRAVEGKARIKHYLGQAMLAWRPDRMRHAQQGVVVAFHRINASKDSSGLTISPELFERFCDFFSRYFNVVPLSALVARLEKRESIGGMLAITFDDGYRDNYEIAAPILKRFKLPATFFVTTGFIESDVVPAWDKNTGVVFPWMRWEQVESLLKDGFEIGAHTRTHVDLGIVSGDSARGEILGSRRDLEDRLNARIDLFAYPFGRADQITDENRTVVAAAGFRCCCSCYGGVNTGSTDPFVIRRVPISNWFASPMQFAFEFATHQL